MRARLTVRNHRGREVPAVLGLVLAAGGAVATVAVALLGHVTAAGWIATGGAGLVTAAGLLDDLSDAGPRGLRGHLRALAAGQVTTGIIKLVTITAVAVVTVAASPPRAGSARVAGVILVAGMTNLWNGLDVRPGRAAKFGLFGVPAVVVADWSLVPFAPGVLIAALLVLPWDAGERAMLGDAGANLLGFTIGLAVFHAVGDGAVVAGAVVAVALNVLAETVTLSRAIDAIPPLRWFDRLGTRP
jgi:hypothetical protein